MSEVKSISSRNSKVTLIVTFLGDSTFILPIWLLFGTNQLNLTVTVTVILFMCIWLVSGLLEIPTGALADRLGRKKMLLVGSLLLSLYPLAYYFELPVALILVVSLISALGSALRSGTMLALTHDSYKKENRSDEEYHAFLSNEKVLTFTARALSGIAGGYLYSLNPHWPYAAMFIVYILMFVVGLFAVDTAVRSKLSNRLHISETFKQVKASQLIIALIGSYIAVQLVGEAVWTAYQPFFEADGISPQLIGVIFSLIAVVSAIGAFTVRYIMKRVGVVMIEIFVGMMVLITCLMLYVPVEAVRIASVIPSAFAFGLTMTPLTATIQKYIGQKYQSTALSIVSVVQYGVYGVASLYIALFIDLFGTETTRTILLAEALIVVLVLITLYVRNNKLDEVITPRELASSVESSQLG